jgi:hypothetical protein
MGVNGCHASYALLLEPHTNQSFFTLKSKPGAVRINEQPSRLLVVLTHYCYCRARGMHIHWHAVPAELPQEVLQHAGQYARSQPELARNAPTHLAVVVGQRFHHHVLLHA